MNFEIFELPEFLDLAVKLNGAIFRMAEFKGYKNVYNKFFNNLNKIEEFTVENFLAGLGEVGG